MFDAQQRGGCEQRDDTDHAAADKVAREDERAPRQTVGDRAAEEQERDARRSLEADGDPELER